MSEYFQLDFQNSFDLSPFPLFILDRNGSLITVNSAWTELTQYSKNESVKKRFTHFLETDSAKIFSDTFSSLLSNIPAEQLTLRIVKKNGESIFIAFSANVIKGNDNNFLYAYCSLSPICEKKKTLAEIDSIINARDESIWAIDTNYKFIFFNKKFKETFQNVLGIELKKGLNPLDVLKDDRLISFWKEKYQAAFKGETQKFIYSPKTDIFPKYSEITLTPIFENRKLTGISAISIDVTEKKLLLEKIEEQKIWYETIFDSSKDAIFITNEDSNFFLVNKAAEELTGYSKSELLQMSIPDLHEEKDLEAYNSFFEKIFSGVSVVTEAKILRKDGTKVDTEFSNTLITIGKQKFMHTIARDISERKYYQAELEKLLDDYKTLFDNSGDAILIFEPENETIFDVNKTATKIYGFSYDEFIGMDLKNISKTPERGKEIIKLAIETGTVPNFFTTHFKKNGEELFFQVSGFVTYFKGKKAIISFNHDITERVRIEKALEEREKFYRLLFESSPVGIYVAKPDGTIIDANPKLLEMLGSPSLEETKKVNLLTLPNLIESKYTEAFVKALETGEITSFDSDYVSKWGRKIFLSSIIVPIKNQKGAVETIFAIIQDRTKEQVYLSELKESETLFRDVFNNSSDAIVISDIETGEYVQVNEGFCKLLEYSEKEVIGNTSIDLGIWKSKEERKKVIENIKTDSGITGHQVTLKTKSGKTKTAIVSTGIVQIKGRKYFLNSAKDITDLISLQNILSETKSLFETLFEELADSVCLLKKNGELIECNNAFLKHLGYDKKEIIGKKPSFYVHKDYKKTIPQKLKSLLRENLILFESIHVSKDGKEIPVEILAKLIKYKGSDAILAVNRDISERKEATRKLMESEKLFRKIFNNSLDAITISDVDTGEYIQVNKGFLEIMGYSADEVIGKTSLELGIWVTEEDRNVFLKKFAEKNHLREYLVKLRSKKGEIKTAIISSEIISIGGKQYFLNTGKDITKFVETQNALAETEKLYETLFEKLADPVVLHKRNLEIIDCNKAFTEMLGYSKEELIGKKPDFFESPKFTSEIPKRLTKIKKKKEILFESLHISKSGKEVPVEINAKIIQYKGEEAILAVNRDISERKETEKILRESEERFRTLFENAADAVIITDLKGNINLVNKKTEHSLQYSNEELLGMNISKIDPLFADKGFYEKFWETLAPEKTITVESVNKRKDGTHFPVESIISEIVLDNEKKIIAFTRDISEQRKAQLQQRESERKFRKAFNENIAPMVLTRVDKGLIVDVNDSFCKVSGYSKNEIIGKSERDIELWKSKRDIVAFTKMLFKNRQVKNYAAEFLTKDGRSIHTIIAGSLFELKDSMHSLVTGIDITDEVELSKKLTLSEKKYETLFELSPSGILLEDLEGNILDVNQTYCNMLQYSREELIGKNVSELNTLESPEQIKANVQKIISAKFFNHEVINIRKNKTEIHLALREKLIDLPDGKKGILSIAIDITERKKYETEIQKSRKELKRLTNYLQSVREKERGEMSRRIHDVLGQSLTAVQFETAWLQKNLSYDQKFSERLSRLKTTVEEMIKEVQNISAELRPGILDELGLPFAIEWYCDEFERKSGIKTYKKIEPEELLVDNETSIHIFRILQECLTNVWRHSKATRVNIELKQRSKTIYLSVRDNGIGLDENKLHDFKSLGLLGLKERVFSLHGQIDFISAPEKGTKIKIVIPLTNPENNLT